MSDKKSDEKKLMLMRVYHNTVREPLIMIGIIKPTTASQSQNREQTS